MYEEDPIFEFNKQIIEATNENCVAYKLNLAFYETQGHEGWQSLKKTLDYIPKDIFTIADAKRGDIGNTSKKYAQAFFEQLNFDCLTINPYMGEDSVSPYLEYSGKWVALLALTSNQGSSDFQDLKLENGHHLYEEIIRISRNWGSDQNTIYVVGATKSERLNKVRAIIPNHLLLIPGVGAQGGDLKSVSEQGMNSNCGLLVNSSRGIIYSRDGRDFAKAAKNAARDVQQHMEEYLQLFMK